MIESRPTAVFEREALSWLEVTAADPDDATEGLGVRWQDHSGCRRQRVARFGPRTACPSNSYASAWSACRESPRAARLPRTVPVSARCGHCHGLHSFGRHSTVRIV